MMYICPMYSRELLKGILKPIIFKLLSENDKMYGYEITQTVKKISGNKILIKEGSLYPALHALTKEGFLEVESIPIGNRIRKYYRLTRTGKTQVEPITNELLEFSTTLQTLFQQKTVMS
ncbi:PadR family transcriptional regulator [Spongiimicrobium salis]|uniref:PadR family transcriptional regulator n=1 Tax=Spongiimicrobium salis TaxID=1667022 RepID=UPI00374CC382